jgi:hypothetical protein
LQVDTNNYLYDQSRTNYWIGQHLRTKVDLPLGICKALHEQGTVDKWTRTVGNFSVPGTLPGKDFGVPAHKAIETIKNLDDIRKNLNKQGIPPVPVLPSRKPGSEPSPDPGEEPSPKP